MHGFLELNANELDANALKAIDKEIIMLIVMLYLDKMKSPVLMKV